VVGRPTGVDLIGTALSNRPSDRARDDRVDGVSADLTGQRLGHYLVQSVLGYGGMSTVYRAVDERLDRPVALKVISENLSADQEFRKRFVEEARAASAIDHVNVVPLYDFGEAESWLYIAMRLVDGTDLAREVADGPLAQRRVLDLLGQVGEALDMLHESGLVHLDVKPANVLITRNESIGREHVYLADFGLTRRGTSGHRTASGDFLGSPTYASPEHLRGDPVLPAADLYSLTCVLFSCLAGRAPFVGTVREVVSGHLRGQVPSLAALTGLPSSIDRVIARGLAADPTLRYPSSAELLGSARRALTSYGADDTESGGGPTPSADFLPPVATEVVTAAASAAAIESTGAASTGAASTRSTDDKAEQPAASSAEGAASAGVASAGGAASADGEFAAAPTVPPGTGANTGPVPVVDSADRPTFDRPAANRPADISAGPSQPILGRSVNDDLSTQAHRPISAAPTFDERGLRPSGDDRPRYSGFTPPQAAPQYPQQQQQRPTQQQQSTHHQLSTPPPVAQRGQRGQRQPSEASRHRAPAKRSPWPWLAAGLALLIALAVVLIIVLTDGKDPGPTPYPGPSPAGSSPATSPSDDPTTDQQSTDRTSAEPSSVNGGSSANGSGGPTSGPATRSEILPTLINPSQISGVSGLSIPIVTPSG